MKIKKVKMVEKYKQKEWLKPYFNLNTELRLKAENKSGKNLCKSTSETIWKICR